MDHHVHGARCVALGAGHFLHRHGGLDADPRQAGRRRDNNGPRFGVFGTTVLAFFLAEMGDKTQIATVMLAAKYSAYYWVIAGTTVGMMLANAPVVWFGERMTRLVPMRVVHGVSAAIFAGLGMWALLA